VILIGPIGTGIADALHHCVCEGIGAIRNQPLVVAVEAGNLRNPARSVANRTAGEHFVAAGVIDPPGSIDGVELELLGDDRYEARVCAEGWLPILPPGTGGYRQRATFRYQSGKSVESAMLPPAGLSVDSGGTEFAPL
jgi:hypothetical protein